jgi:sortase A
VANHRRTRPAHHTWTLTFLVLVGVALCAIQVVKLPVWADQAATRQQQADTQALRRTWQQEPAPTSFARPDSSAAQAASDKKKPLGRFLLSVPSWNKEWALQTYRSAADLDRGPSWFSFTQPPGVAGNFAVIGHRTTHGSPFARLPDLALGSHVRVETSTKVFTYKVTNTAYRVKDTNVKVLDPDPTSSEPATAATLTLITCETPFSNNRLVVRAQLESVSKK